MGDSVPTAAEFVVDMQVDGEVTAGIGRLNVGSGGIADLLVDLQTTVETVAEIGVIVGVGVPYHGVDAHLIVAAATGAHAADVHTPTEHPAIVNCPIVTEFNLPCTVKGAADELMEVAGGYEVVQLVDVVARVFGGDSHRASMLSGFAVSWGNSRLIIRV